MNFLNGAVSAIFGLLSVCVLALPAAAGGLSVSNGGFLLEGKPFQAVGVNYFSLFSRVLANADDKSSLTNIALLAREDISFARFMCGGFWPREQQLYITNRALFFERLDIVVRCAESNRFGLIPSLFWHIPTVPDLAGEPMQALGDPKSRSIAYVRRFTRDVVSRYHQSPAIWAWEFGNEFNLGVDLPNAAEHRPPTPRNLGTPAARTARDEFRAADMMTAYNAFGEAVRELDRTRPILSGNAIPRPHAWHNSHERNWKSDSSQQFADILARDNPDPLDTITIHLYPAPSFPGGRTNLTDIIQLSSVVSKKLGKPLFIGEFGVNRERSPAEQRQFIQDMLRAMRENDVGLAALWVFDYPAQEADWNVTFENDRAWMLKMVGEYNRSQK